MNYRNLILLSGLALTGLPNIASAGACGPEQMSIRGSFNSWGTDAMACEGDKWVFTKDFNANSQLKFDVFGNWSENYGDNSPADGNVDRSGDNIRINDAGTYKVEFDYNANPKTYLISPASNEFECGVEAMRIRKTATFEEVEMNCVDGVFVANDVSLYTRSNGVDGPDITHGFWFAELTNGQTDFVNFWGDQAPADGTADQQADSISGDVPPSMTVTYDMTFDYATKAYTVESEDQSLDCNSDTMYIRGDFNGYNNDTEMECDGSTWRYTLAFAGADDVEFKFDRFGDWTDNYGDNTPSGALDDAADSFGQNIVISGAGTYLILFDYDGDNSTYSVIRRDSNNTCGAEGMKLVRTLIGEPQLDMECEGGSWIVRDVSLFKKGNGVDGPDVGMGFWFYEVINGEANSENRYGDWEPDGFIDLQAPAIATEVVPTQFNTFDIRLNLETQAYDYEVNDIGRSCTPSSIFLRGSFNSWGTTPFECNNELGAYEIVQTLEAGDQFKFDIQGDWSENYGSSNSDNIADSRGQNFRVDSAGDYRIQFNYNTDKSFTIEKVGGSTDNCGTDEMTIRGSFNSWSTQAMTCNDGIWEAEISSSSNNIRFKFDRFGNWSENYGDNDPSNNDVNAGGNNITIQQNGTYTVRFDYKASPKTYYVQ